MTKQNNLFIHYPSIPACSWVQGQEGQLEPKNGMNKFEITETNIVYDNKQCSLYGSMINIITADKKKKN